MIPAFDPNRPHGQVFGMEPACWQQHGHYYLRDGTPVGEEEAAAEPEAEPQPTTTPDPKVGPDDLRLKSNQLLKAQLDVYGEPWAGVAAARRFLEGKA